MSCLLRLLLVSFILLAGSFAAEAHAAKRPRLVVVVSIDQFPYEYLERMRSNFDPKGMFLRLCDEGANFINCHHGHAFTKTAPGHSVLLTGTFPYINGIVDNDWFDRQLKRTVYCVEDSAYKPVGNLAAVDEEEPDRAKDSQPAKKTGKTRGISPRNLLVGTLGDVMKLANPQAKVFGIALKDRAGVLMAGHAADGVYWFDAETGNWVTSTYYRDALPAWLRNYNESAAAEAFAGQSWTQLYGPEKYLAYPPKAAGLLFPKPGFPHVMAAKPGPLYYTMMTISPYGNQLTLDTARLLLTSEKLGQDDVTDLLAINLSSNDYVGHAFGPHSLEVQDITWRTDRLLADFAAFIDEQLHGEPWVMALSSDHGVAPLPEYAAELKLPAGRDPLGSARKLIDSIEARLRAQLGEGSASQSYVLAVEDNNVYLDRQSPGLAGDRFIAAQRVVRDFLLEQPGVAVAFTREDLLAQSASEGLALTFQRALHSQRSGDVLFALRPYYINGKTPATHGSPWEYDSHVPLLFWGAGIRPGRYSEPATPAAMAPTLARLIGVDEPSSCVVDALDDALATPNQR